MDSRHTIPRRSKLMFSSSARCALQLWTQQLHLHHCRSRTVHPCNCISSSPTRHCRCCHPLPVDHMCSGRDCQTAGTRPEPNGKTGCVTIMICIFARATQHETYCTHTCARKQCQLVCHPHCRPHSPASGRHIQQLSSCLLSGLGG